MRDSAVVARRFHLPKVSSSNLLPATKAKSSMLGVEESSRRFVFSIE
jgi:hypothetical protein